MKLIIAFACFVALVSAFPSKPDNRQVYKATTRTGRIYGGTNAEEGEFPYQISLWYTYIVEYNHTCGGSILSETKVLSAAHCKTEVPGTGRFTLHAGVTSFDRTEFQQSIPVSNFVLHPEFPGGVDRHDIMIVTLPTPLTFNARVTPIALPDTLNELPTGRVVLSGWGLIEGRQSPRDLKKADMEIEPLLTCQENIEALIGPSPLDPRDDGANICTAGGRAIQDPLAACSGDSGGPLVDFKGDKPIQVGVVAWGVGDCSVPKAPTVYTKVSHFLEWIAEHM